MEPAGEWREHTPDMPEHDLDGDPAMEPADQQREDAC
jgi:hypothetical protein